MKLFLSSCLILLSMYLLHNSLTQALSYFLFMLISVNKKFPFLVVLLPVSTMIMNLIGIRLLEIKLSILWSLILSCPMSPYYKLLLRFILNKFWMDLHVIKLSVLLSGNLSRLGEEVIFYFISNFLVC